MTLAVSRGMAPLELLMALQHLQHAQGGAGRRGRCVYSVLDGGGDIWEIQAAAQQLLWGWLGCHAAAARPMAACQVGGGVGRCSLTVPLPSGERQRSSMGREASMSLLPPSQCSGRYTIM